MTWHNFDGREHETNTTYPDAPESRSLHEVAAAFERVGLDHEVVEAGTARDRQIDVGEAVMTRRRAHEG